MSAELFRRHLGNIAQPIERQDLDVYAHHVIAEFPYAPEGHTRRLEGREALSGFLARIGQFASGVKIGEPSIVEAGDVLVAEYHGDSIFNDSGKAYSQDYVAVATLEEGQIVSLREYYDPLRVLRALGEIE